jgi:thioredoxin 1
MQSLFWSLLIGGGLGAALGCFGKCTSGTCPLTSTWWRGALYGAVLGLIYHTVAGKSGPGSDGESTPNVKQITEQAFEAEVSASATPVVVDFYATWCGPCKVLGPRLNQLARPLTDKIKFVKIDIDQSRQLSERFNIEGVPTLLFFRGGKVTDKVVGLLPEATLKARLESFASGGANVATVAQ